MSIPVLIEVYNEMRRLAIAGSAVAPGDFRLKKLIQPLEKSGEKAPVFSKVAQAVQALVDSNEKTASGALLELTTLVNAILYTQGETGIAGEIKPLETVSTGGQTTQASARVLKPLLEALSSTGSGRLELIRDAEERGAFRDLRLVKPALQAIDDPYPEISQLITTRVLPAYGKAILPELRAKLDIKGRGGHVQRLRLLHQLDPQGSRDLVQKTLAEGSKEMKVAAIECLGTSDGDLVYLLEHSKAKARDVRAAALRALLNAGKSAGTALETLKKAVDGDDLELIVERMQKCNLPEIQDYLLQQAEAHFVQTLKLKDKKEQGAAIHRLEVLVTCMGRRTDAKAEAFLLNCLEASGALAAIKSDPSGADLNELVASILSRGTPKMQQRLAAAHATLSGDALTASVFAARATMSPEKFFDTFRAQLGGIADKRKKNERAAVVSDVLTSDGEAPWLYRDWLGHVTFGEDESSRRLPELDPRWLDAAIEEGAVNLVCELARAGHKGASKFLSEQLAKTKDEDYAHDLLKAMVRTGHPEATDAVLAAIKKRAKDASSYYFGYYYGSLVADLPRSALPKVEELLPTLPDKFVDSLMDAVLALKNKPE
ncbi:MAG TPA: hypothetical protein VEJ63_22960 [Planctomycetota bacterium]|nr:hypothetical protein [Planctomycetota bacterium]